MWSSRRDISNRTPPFGSCSVWRSVCVRFGVRFVFGLAFVLCSVWANFGLCLGRVSGPILGQGFELFSFDSILFLKFLCYCVVVFDRQPKKEGNEMEIGIIAIIASLLVFVGIVSAVLYAASYPAERDQNWEREGTYYEWNSPLHVHDTEDDPAEFHVAAKLYRKAVDACERTHQKRVVEAFTVGVLFGAFVAIGYVSATLAVHCVASMVFDGASAVAVALLVCTCTAIAMVRAPIVRQLRLWKRHFPTNQDARVADTAEIYDVHAKGGFSV